MAESISRQMDSLSLNTETRCEKINYTNGSDARVKAIDDSTLKNLLIRSDMRKDVVFFGEGNFTFSVAFASLRDSWDGIISTSYEAESVDHHFYQVILNTIDFCIKNGKTFHDQPKEILDAIKDVLCLPQPAADAWIFDIDATNIPSTLNVEGKVVWFQCPWVPQSVRIRTTGELVRNFLMHMARGQSNDDYALIGIANHDQYVKNYELGHDDLLGDNLSNSHAYGYRFLGADKTLVKQILQHGYKHVGYRDIHNYILCSHITLVFQKHHCPFE